jgi:hypothetical protein
MLTDIEKIDVRRHLGVPFAGLATSGLTMGIRTIFQPGQLEFYMQNLQPYEESVLSGRPYGQVRIYGGAVVVGQTVTATVNGIPCTYVVTANDVLSPTPMQSVANGLASAVNLQGGNNGGVFAGGAIVLPNGGPSQLPAFGYVTLVSSYPGTTFTLTSSATGGLTAFTSANGQVVPNPTSTFLDQNGSSVTLTGYIAFCNYLQSNIVSASGNMAMLNAGGPGVAQLRPYEMKQRVELYNYWREQMGTVLSVGKDAWGFRGNTGSNQGGASA